MEGRAAAVYPNGQKYEGVFSKSLRDGRGTIIFPNGAVYEGRFKKDKFEGQGTFSLPRVVQVSSGSRGGVMEKEGGEEAHEEYLVPVTIADMEHIHVKSGFTAQGC